MVGGVLADRYERKKVILLAPAPVALASLDCALMHCCLNRIAGNLFTWFMGWFFRITWR